MANDIKKKAYYGYLKDGERFTMVGETVTELSAGFYQPCYDDYHDRTYFISKKVLMPNLYVLSNEVQKTIIDDIKNFWNSEERYKKFGSVYKRNILLYSTPGNGKTSLVNIICNQLINDYNGVVIMIDSIQDLKSYDKCMDRLREVEPTRKIVTVIEDFERLTKDDHFASLLLQILDGNKQYDNIVTIATTNYPQILEKRFVCRPSRFNIVIEYPKPNEQIRREYIMRKLKDGGVDITNEEIQKSIERYVKKSDGYTFDFVKELVQGIYVDNLGEDKVFERLEDIKNKNGNISVTDDASSKIGFRAEYASSLVPALGGGQSTVGEGFEEDDGFDEYDHPESDGSWLERIRPFHP